MSDQRTPREQAGKHVSWSQLSRQCGLQLKYARERRPEERRSIDLVLGIAIHEGLEGWAQARIDGRPAPLEDALARAALSLSTAFENSKSGVGPPISFDEAPQLTLKGEPYADDRCNIDTPERACKLVRFHVRQWVSTCGRSVAPAWTEREIVVALQRPAGWRIKCRLDIGTENAELIDFKFSGQPWGQEKLRSYLPQAHLYHAAFYQEFGVEASDFQFHVLAAGEPGAQIFHVPFDPPVINAYLEHVVRPQIAAIDAGIFIPRTSGWWCSERWCPYWQGCPLGHAAQPADPLIEAET